MNEADRKHPCPICLADAGQPCFMGDGPSERVHLARRVLMLCTEKGKSPEETRRLIDMAGTE